MTARSALALAAFLLAGTAVRADPTLECGLSGETQVEIGDCLAAAEAAVDAALAQAFGFAADAARGLDETTGRPVAAPALEAGQAAWSAYRDAHCAYVGTTWGGGSGSGAAIRACRIDLGRARTDALMRFAG